MIKTGLSTTWLLSQIGTLLIFTFVGSNAAVFPVKSFDNFNKAQQQAVSGDSIVRKSGFYADVILDYQPEKVVLVNNLFLDPTNSIISDPTGKESLAGNVLNQSVKNLPNGFDRIKHKAGETKALQKFYSSDYPKLLDIPTLDDDPSLELDVMKQSRTNTTAQFVGCFIPNKQVEMKPYATAENTGPVYIHNIY